MSSGGEKMARLKSAALKVAALINAVEKNSKFRQLASYFINVLTKAARAHESLDLRASNVVMAACTRKAWRC
jgi:phage anti-repressor protein